MYRSLHTAPTQGGLSLDDALDLLEIDEVGQSWRAAVQRNADRLNDILEERRGQRH